MNSAKHHRSLRLTHLFTAASLILTAQCTNPGLEADGFFDSNGVQIHYLVRGEGEPVLLIHGFTGNGETMWGGSGLLERAAREFQVIAMDCRGHGMSGKPHDSSSYGQEMVSDVFGLLDHLGIQSAHLMGYSMGAEIIVKALTQHPERIRSAVLGGSGWSSDREYDLWEVLATTVEEGTGFGPYFEAATPEGAEPPSPEQIAEWNELLLTGADTAALAAAARGMEALRVTEDEMRAVTTPVLGISGEFDGERPMLERMQGVVPNFQLVIFEGLDHGGAAFSPKLADNTLEFLRKISSSDSK